MKLKLVIKKEQDPYNQVFAATTVAPPPIAMEPEIATETQILNQSLPLINFTTTNHNPHTHGFEEINIFDDSQHQITQNKEEP